MKPFILTSVYMLLSLVLAEREGCHGDNCANHVTGTFAGIGVPIASRISLCNKYLHATIKPHAVTVMTTVSKYTTSLQPVVTLPTNTAINTTTTPAGNETISPIAVPTFAAVQCPEKGQFSSACHCWAEVTPGTTRLPTPTVTVTTTRWFDVGCGPAATAVASKDLFPCSGRWGMCACLRGGGADEVCVRVSSLWERPGQGNATGPCAQTRECDADGDCENSKDICVYDGSCGCGKRRCYRAAPEGCDYQGLPIEDVDERRL